MGSIYLGKVDEHKYKGVMLYIRQRDDLSLACNYLQSTLGNPRNGLWQASSSEPQVIILWINKEEVGRSILTQMEGVLGLTLVKTDFPDGQGHTFKRRVHEEVIGE